MKLQEIWPQDEWATHSEALQEIGDIYHSSRNWRHLKADGSEIHVLTFGRRVAFDGRDGYLVAIVDITERRKAEARIAHMAHHDGLTNLPNRDFYQDRLRQALERSQAGNKRVAVLCVDLDLFKNVNDAFGHPMGDRLLKAVAERLRGASSRRQSGRAAWRRRIRDRARLRRLAERGERLCGSADPDIERPLRHRRHASSSWAPASASRCRPATATPARN